MVKIKFLTVIFFIIFSNYGYCAQKFQIIRDAEIEFFLHKLIKSVVQIDKNKNYFPRLVLNHQFNAFVVGNSNKIYINTGLINKSNSLSEIQAILAHEIGHLVLNHHSARLIKAEQIFNYSKFATLAGLALSAEGKLDTNTAMGLIIGSNDLSKKSLLQFSRIQEQQADKFALDQMIKRKISLNGLEVLLSNLSNNELSNKNTSPIYYRTHPFSKQRLKQLKKYKSIYQKDSLAEKKIVINDNIISLEYIKNKIKAYDTDPFEVIKNLNKKNDFLSNFSKSIALYRIGKYELAHKKISSIKDKFKDYPFYYEFNGDIFFKKGAFDKAIEEYKKAIKSFQEIFNPSTDLIKFSLVKTYLQSNKKTDLKKSIIILEELLLNNPNWSYLWRLLAKSSGRLNNKGIAYIALAEEALIKKNFIMAKKYVDLANKQSTLPSSYKLRGWDIVERIKLKK